MCRHSYACACVGEADQTQTLTIISNGSVIFEESRIALERSWSEVSFAMAGLRDNPSCVKEESLKIEKETKGLAASVIPKKIEIPDRRRSKAQMPRVAILREQGVNGQIEMAYAFNHCGFEAIDVHMSDLMSGRQTLEYFDAVAACGGMQGQVVAGSCVDLI